ncbi:MAG: response regulator [Candidatus Riflebacteria bacterium]|nr:response regulator [Candidatus Riflebacteria bacterium]
MAQKKLTVVIVDDSNVFLNVLSEVVSRNPLCEIAGKFGSGEEALDFLSKNTVDLLMLDLELPGIGGLEVLEKIIEINESQLRNPQIETLIISLLSLPGAEVTIKALEIGAFDFIAKPEGTYLPRNMEILKKQLYEKIEMCFFKKYPSLKKSTLLEKKPKSGIVLRNDRSYSAVLIGASTGGPKAVMSLIPELSNLISLPIIVAIHMPAVFSEVFAQNLNRRHAKHQVIECSGGEIIENEHVYLAPGGKNLVLKKGNEGKVVTLLDDTPNEETVFPSINSLFRSAANTFDGPLIAVLLTGMGNDGCKALSTIKRSGGYVVAQNETSSVVWGMPGNAVASGLVDAVAPLSKITDEIFKRVSGLHSFSSRMR